MHHDKKVGLGLGILLVGIVGAFFFREEPSAREALPELQSAEILDRKITGSLAKTSESYTKLEQYERRYQSAVDLEGIDIATQADSDPDVPANVKQVFDEEFDFLNEPGEEVSEPPKAIVKQEEPIPAGQLEKIISPAAEQPQTSQDLVVSKVAPQADFPDRKEMFVADLPPIKERIEQPVAPQEPPSTVTDTPKQEPLSHSTNVSLTEKTEGSHETFTQDELKDNEPQPPKRDRRVIVPRRVRLNEPIATNPNTARSELPRATFKLTPSEQESEDHLPTLEGLEPLDLPR